MVPLPSQRLRKGRVWKRCVFSFKLFLYCFLLINDMLNCFYHVCFLCMILVLLATAFVTDTHLGDLGSTATLPKEKLDSPAPSPEKWLGHSLCTAALSKLRRSLCWELRCLASQRELLGLLCSTWVWARHWLRLNQICAFVITRFSSSYLLMAVFN